jgi:hypothetical protein
MLDPEKTGHAKVFPVLQDIFGGAMKTALSLPGKRKPDKSFAESRVHCGVEGRL